MPFRIRNLKFLFNQVDISSIILFRIAFGAIMLVEVFRYFDHRWISRYWINTTINFPYWPFLSLKPLEGDGMYYLFIVLGILSIFIMIGLFYRVSILLFFISFSYMFLLEQARYLNHFYLIVLLSFVMLFIPAHKNFSLDALWLKNIRSRYIPLWYVWLLRFMIGIPFFFGGIAKINPDWLAGQPLQMWLANDTDFPLIGHLFTEHWMILIMSYSGLIIDVLLVPLLLYKRTRVWAFLVGVTFHLMNSKLFEIGIFPWFMIASTTLFFQPNWPRLVIHSLLRKKETYKESIQQSETTVLSRKQKFLLAVLGFWVLIMIAVPLRHFLIPGNVNWTEEGHKYSWHMKLRSKKANGVFIVRDKDGRFADTLDLKNNLPKWQYRTAIARPPIIWQLANVLKKDYAQRGHDVSVYADIKARLNGRPYQQFINPEIDISAEPFPVWKADWIVPLSTPLPKKRSLIKKR
ncbi:HTTM domain-containing protein [Aquimarina sp. 2304DJ70-9]|uniref:HTTM domain-containing protein n=1 Tax=Aquimarina penaris TaxID=3231044 RepID=UPI0034627339